MGYVFANVYIQEKPGIKVIFIHNTALCQRCGFVIEFSDPSYYDGETDTYRWAFDQTLLHEQKKVEVEKKYIEYDNE